MLIAAVNSLMWYRRNLLLVCIKLLRKPSTYLEFVGGGFDRKQI